MAKLNEEELILLVNYMYIKGSTYIDNLANNINVLYKDVKADIDETLLSGDVSRSEALDVLDRMKSNENIMNLKTVESIDGDIRAICVVDKRDGEASFIIRGTGGTYRAWYDNLKGLVVSDTKLQLDMANFFNKISPMYNINTIIGHSKGGNLSQYIMVTCKNSIERCYSIDGQGFSNKFFGKYKNEIAAVRDKIISISSYMDPVNGLMKPITKERIYVKTDLDNISIADLSKNSSRGIMTALENLKANAANSHKSTKFLKFGMFKNGNLSREFHTKQHPDIKSTMSVINSIQILPGLVKNPAASLIGFSLARVMSKGEGKFSLYAKEKAIGALKAFPGYIIKETIKLPYSIPKFTYDLSKNGLNSFKKSFVLNNNLTFKEKLKAIINKEYRKDPLLIESVTKKLSKLQILHDSISSQSMLNTKELDELKELEFEMNEYKDFLNDKFNNEFNDKLVEIDKKLENLTNETEKISYVSDERYNALPEIQEEKLRALEPEINFCLKVDYSNLLKDYEKNHSDDLKDKIITLKEQISLSDEKLKLQDNFKKDSTFEYIERKNNNLEYKLSEKLNTNSELKHKSLVFSENPKFENLVKNKYSSITEINPIIKTNLTKVNPSINGPFRNSTTKNLESKKNTLDRSKNSSNYNKSDKGNKNIER